MSRSCQKGAGRGPAMAAPEPPLQCCGFARTPRLRRWGWHQLRVVLLGLARAAIGAVPGRDLRGLRQPSIFSNGS